MLVGVLIVIAVSIALARMEPAAPTVERATVLVDTVKRGSIIRQDRGLGTLVPEDTRWLPHEPMGASSGSFCGPEQQVEPDTVILELSNPQRRAGGAQREAGAAFRRSRARKPARTARKRVADPGVADRRDRGRVRAGPHAGRGRRGSGQRAADLGDHAQAVAAQGRNAQETVGFRGCSGSRPPNNRSTARLRVQQAAVDQARAVSDLQASRLAALKVTPGFSGVLQQVPVEVGQRWPRRRTSPGSPIRAVSRPS